MAPIQAVLVSSPDEDVVSSLTATLRDRWPTRTATSPDETTRSLDENVTVVVFDTAFEGVSLDDLAAMTAEQSPDAQVLQLGTSMDPNAGRADAVLTHAAETDTICSTVDRLQRRARYNRLLSRFYSLSRARSERASENETDQSTQEIADIKCELDELAAALDDEDLFDAALGSTDGVP